MAKPASESVRAELERRALQAACSVDGVIGPSAQGARGVACVPLPDGGFRVELHLVAGVVSLPALAEAVRDRIERAVRRTGLRGELRSIDVAFDDIDETAPQPRRRRSPLRAEGRR